MKGSSLQIILWVVLSLTSFTSATKCTYQCEWPDVHRTLCDSRFVNIFRGAVLRRDDKRNTEEDYVEYAVQIHTIYRTLGVSHPLSEGNVAIIRTTPHKYLCPVKKMDEGFTAWFATGPVEDNGRILADSCTSFITRNVPPEVESDLRRGKFHKPC